MPKGWWNFDLQRWRWRRRRRRWRRWHIFFHAEFICFDVNAKLWANNKFHVKWRSTRTHWMLTTANDESNNHHIHTSTLECRNGWISFGHIQICAYCALCNKWRTGCLSIGHTQTDADAHWDIETYENGHSDKSSIRAASPCPIRAALQYLKIQNFIIGIGTQSAPTCMSRHAWVPWWNR